MEALWYAFLQQWLVGAIGALIGAYWRRPADAPRLARRQVGGVFLSTWAFAFVAALPCTWLAAQFSADPARFDPWGRTILPMALAAAFARVRFQALRRATTPAASRHA